MHAQHLATLPCKDYPDGRVTYLQGGVPYKTPSGKTRFIVAQNDGDHTLFHRHDTDGTWLDHIRLLDTGHCHQFGVRRDPDALRILMRWGKAVRWVKYEAGDWTWRTVHDAIPGATPAWNDRSDLMLLRDEYKPKTHRFTVHQAGRIHVKTKALWPALTFREPTGHPVQGFYSTSHRLFVLTGATAKPSAIRWWWWKNPAQQHQIDVSDLVTGNREFEGLYSWDGQLGVGVRVGGNNLKRTFGLYLIPFP